MYIKLPKWAKGMKTCQYGSHFKPICTKIFCGIFTQSFDAFWGHLNILKINCKVVSTTSSSMWWRPQNAKLSYRYRIGHFIDGG